MVDCAKIPYVYVVIRTDIPVEHQITQACHAALEIGFDHSRPQGPPVHLITLAAQDAEDLCRQAERLEQAGIDYHLFSEPDEQNGAVLGHTALASVPIQGAHRRLFSRRPLWRTPSQDRD